MTKYDQIRLTADLELGLGETGRFICPFCSGGMSGERSLWLCKSENGAIYFRCFRASCGVAGTAGVGWGDTEKARPARTHRLERELYPVDCEERNAFLHRFGFLPKRPMLWEPEIRYYGLPVYGPTGKQRGTMLRTWGTPIAKGKKAIAYPEVADEPFIHWTEEPENRLKLVIVVEDWVSAEKVNKLFPLSVRAVALLGTHMDYTRALEIAKVSCGAPVLICLDRDATGLAVKHHAKFREVIPNLAVFPLVDDIKDIEAERITPIVEYGKAMHRGSDQGPEVL